MCGAPKEQTVTTKTELDPALRRLLYGGTAANPRGGFDSAGSSAGSSSGSAGVAAPAMGTNINDNSMDNSFGGLGDYSGATDFGGSPSGSSGNGGLYANGGMVGGQQGGIASLNQGRMPTPGGNMPNLSDPRVAATLAMALRRPESMYGTSMGYAQGGYIEGPGTGTSDSVDAMIYQNGHPVREARLSDGEFVMTEDAVNGAGGGDPKLGAARMYEMMRKFERGGSV